MKKRTFPTDLSNMTPVKMLSLFDALCAENIQINPIFIKLSGSIAGAYFLTQLIYLSRANNHSEFSAKDKYFYEKLYISEWELRTQKKNLSNLNLINIRHGKGNLTFYSVNILNIIQQVVDNPILRNEDSSAQKRGILGSRNEDSSFPYKGNKTHFINTLKDTTKPHVDKMISPDDPLPQNVFKKINDENGNVTHLTLRLQDIDGITGQNIKWIFKNFEQFEIVNVLESFKNVKHFKKTQAAYIMGCFQKIMKEESKQK